MYGQRKIAVVVASLPSQNNGMLAVNLAALKFFSPQRFLDSKFDFFEPVRRFIWNRNSTELLDDVGRLSSYDKVIYWGDWLQTQDNLRAYSKISGKDASVIDGLLLPRFSKAALADVAIVGTTLTLDSALRRADRHYGQLLESLHASAGLVKMRDVVSSGYVENWRDDSCLGLDMAFLFCEPPDQPAFRRNVGVFFGRTDEQDRSKASEFTKNLLDAVGLEWTVVDWSKRTSAPENCSHGKLFFDDCNSCLIEGHEDTLNKLASTIRSLQFVITDTYHLAVFAWAQGVPAILFGNVSNAHGLRLNSGDPLGAIDKRYALMLTLDALPFFVPLEDLCAPETRARRNVFLIQSVITNVDLVEHVLKNIRGLRNRVSFALASWISS